MTSHAKAGASPVNKAALLRYGEQMAVVFGAAFVPAFAAAGASFDKSTLIAAAAAGLRAVYEYAKPYVTAFVARRLGGKA